MKTRILEVPMIELVKRVRKKKKQFDEEWEKEPANIHNLEHIASDLAGALHGIKERLKKTK